jgi:hypothetical protein
MRLVSLAKSSLTKARRPQQKTYGFLFYFWPKAKNKTITKPRSAHKKLRYAENKAINVELISII